MNRPRWQALAALGFIFLLFAGSAHAQDGRFEVGPKVAILSGSGEPTNDIPVAGIFGRYKLNDRWWIGASIESSDEFDVEGAAALVGLVQDPSVAAIDAKGSSTAVHVWVERVYGRDQGRLLWFWSAGLGFNSVDVDPVTGPLADGGTFDIATDAGSETILSAGGGLRYYLGAKRRTALELAVRGEQRFTDWTLADRQSGATGVIDDYFIKGLHFGLSFRF